MEETNRKTETSLDDILEIVVAIKDTMATKDDVAALELKIHALDNKMTMEFQFIRAELDDIKASLARLEKRTREDSDAASKEILSLQRRVQQLEQQVKQLQNARQIA